jgi:hypothetical protein
MASLILDKAILKNLAKEMVVKMAIWMMPPYLKHAGLPDGYHP